MAKALAPEQAGIDRGRAYVTNVVKHFKWEPRGKARIHKTPNAAEQLACRPWLEAELAVLQPTVVVALGATAAKNLLGKAFKVTEQRGRWQDAPELLELPTDRPRPRLTPITIADRITMGYQRLTVNVHSVASDHLKYR